MMPRRPTPPTRRAISGLSMIEIIMTIVIMAVLMGSVALFITKPITGYVDSQRRADLANAADIALRRISREVRTAIPYSVRLTGTSSGDCMEFIYSSTGGRYRDSTVDGSTGGDSLSFTNSADTTFNMLGVSIAQTDIAVGDWIVINSLSGATPYDTTTKNRAQIAALTAATSTITLSGGTNIFATQSPARPSPSQQFQVVPDTQKAVTYRCNGGELRRYSNYGFNTAQVCPPTGGSNNLIVANNATCQFNFSYTFDLLYMKLSVSDSTGEAVDLFDQVHVDNAP